MKPSQITGTVMTWLRASGWLSSSLAAHGKKKQYFLRVIPTLTHYPDIVPDIPSGHIYSICIYIYICIFWDSIWHSIWHLVWHSIWHLFWHMFWHSIWQSFWHSLWHIFWHSVWHSIWHSVWHSIWHVFGSRRAPLHPAVAIGSGPGVLRCIRGWQRRTTRRKARRRTCTFVKI